MYKSTLEMQFVPFISALIALVCGLFLSGACVILAIVLMRGQEVLIVNTRLVIRDVRRVRVKHHIFLFILSGLFFTRFGRVSVCYYQGYYTVPYRIVPYSYCRLYCQ